MCVKILRILKKTHILTHTHTHTHTYIYIMSFKAQSITKVYLNRKTLNLITKNYPKQYLESNLSQNLNSIIKNNLNY